MAKNMGNNEHIFPQDVDNYRKARTLMEDAYNRIKQMIFHQELNPGQRLIYRDLSETLNMSRTPIINALYRLEQEGFVISESFRGFYVKPVDIQEAWDLFGVREALEAYAIEQAIDRAGPGEITILEEQLQKHEQYMPARYDKKKAALEAEFHLQIAAMTNNRVLENLLRINFEHLYLRFNLDYVDPKRMPQAVKEHHDILDKIRKKDLPTAVEAIRLHVRKGRNAVVAGISKKKEPIQISSRR